MSGRPCGCLLRAHLHAVLGVAELHRLLGPLGCRLQGLCQIPAAGRLFSLEGFCSLLLFYAATDTDPGASILCIYTLAGWTRPLALPGKE